MPTDQPSKNPKNDKRIHVSKRMLKDALLELLIEKSIQNITIKDICTKANISRGTFYAHYFDQFELLDELENDMLQNILGRLNDTLFAATNQNLLAELLSVLKDNATFLNAIIASQRGTKFLERILNICIEKTHDNFSTQKNTANNSTIQKLSQFIVGGSAALVVDWLKNNMDEPIDDIAQKLLFFSNSLIRSYKNKIN